MYAAQSPIKQKFAQTSDQTCRQNKSWSSQCESPTAKDKSTSPKGITNNLKNMNKGATPAKRGRSSPGKYTPNKTKQSKLDNYWLATPSASNSNRFAVLDQEEINRSTSPPQTRKEPRPPPIFVSGVSNIQPLQDLLLNVAVDGFVLKVTGGSEVKIQPQSAKQYTAITAALAEKKTEFHTYKLKQERNFNIVLKGMHSSTPTDDIREAIENLGHQVVNICNMRQWKTKKPLPMFYISLKAGNKNKELYACDNLLYTKIKFEAPRKRREIPQCTRCQRYGHTKHFCNRSPRCVKCVGNHLTIDCPKRGISKEVKCVLCDGNHPANYKGCTIYKDLQRRTYPTLRKKELPNVVPNSEISQPAITKNTLSYAEALKINNRAQEKPQPTTEKGTVQKETNNEIEELKRMVRTLVEQMGTVLNLLTAMLPNVPK